MLVFLQSDENIIISKIPMQYIRIYLKKMVFIPFKLTQARGMEIHSTLQRRKNYITDVEKVLLKAQFNVVVVLGYERINKIVYFDNNM